MKNIEWRRWTVLLAAVAFLTAQGCRERGDYQPPGYVPPPPPPPAQAQAQTEPSGPAPLQKIDLAKMEPRLKDPKDAKDPSVDLKSVIAGIEDNELVIRFETYGEPFKDQNTWFLAWLSTRESPLLYKVQVSHEGHYVLGGVFENDKVESEEQLRYDDEFVRHKVLDLLGDLCLLGRPLRGHLLAYRCGHELNHRLVRLLASLSGGC